MVVQQCMKWISIKKYYYYALNKPYFDTEINEENKNTSIQKTIKDKSRQRGKKATNWSIGKLVEKFERNLKML